MTFTFPVGIDTIMRISGFPPLPLGGLSAPFILHTPAGFCFSMCFGGHVIMEKYGECKGPSEGWFFIENWG